MALLIEILGSKIRAEVFRLLFGVTDAEIHVREIERRTGFNDRALRQEMERLVRLDLVNQRRSGNRVYFRANKLHPCYVEIHRLVIKSSGLVDILKERLAGPGVTLSFVFGSFSEGTEIAGSDIDLMVVGQVGLRELATMLSGVSDELGREINPHILSPGELQHRAEIGDHFVASILAGPKLFIKGSEHDLGELGTERLASAT